MLREESFVTWTSKKNMTHELDINPKLLKESLILRIPRAAQLQTNGWHNDWIHNIESLFLLVKHNIDSVLTILTVDNMIFIHFFCMYYIFNSLFSQYGNGDYR